MTIPGAFQANGDGSAINPSSVPMTPNRGLVSVGPGPWNGQGAGHFAGNASGTAIAVAVPSSFPGHLVDIQVNGATLFYVDHTGGVFADGFLSLIGQAFLQGALSLARRTATATGAIGTTDCTVWADATTAAFTLTLPAASACFNGQVIAVVKVDSAAHTVTLAANGTDTVNGAASVALASAGNGGIFQTDAVSKWWEIG